MSKRRDRQGRPTLPEPLDSSKLFGKKGEELPVLVVLTGAQLGQRIRLEQPAVIGRDPEADLMLTDASVAWHHARVEPAGEGWRIRDLTEGGSAPEVNGVPAPEHRLGDDDQISIGTVVLRFELHDPIEQAYDEAVLERLNKDELTGLLARRAFDAAIRSAVERATRQKEPLGVIVLDVDRLKAINDRHGHLAGASVISQVGGALADAVPPSSLACRLGGDEFAVALRGYDRELTLAVAERLRSLIEQLDLSYEQLTLSVKASVGVSMFPDHGDTANRLLRDADEAMYRAKRAGGNRVACAAEAARDAGGDSI